MPASHKSAMVRKEAHAERATSGASSVGRVFDVLDLFSVERPVLRIEDVEALLGYTRSTAYRYVRALAEAGLVASIGGGHYALGARAVELDRLLQLTDPLLHAGQAVMPDLLAQAQESAFLLCTLYGEKVLCIHHEGPLALTYKARKVNISRPRGSVFPLVSGAASLVILANLAARRIKALFLNQHHAIAAAGLAATWQELKSVLAEIRRRGYAFSTGTFNPYLAGVAVPILSTASGEVLGSLTQVSARDEFDPPAQEAVALALAKGAARIAGRVSTTRLNGAKSAVARH